MKRVLKSPYGKNDQFFFGAQKSFYYTKMSLRAEKEGLGFQGTYGLNPPEAKKASVDLQAFPTIPITGFREEFDLDLDPYFDHESFKNRSYSYISEAPMDGLDAVILTELNQEAKAIFEEMVGLVGSPNKVKTFLFEQSLEENFHPIFAKYRNYKNRIRQILWSSTWTFNTLNRGLLTYHPLFTQSIIDAFVFLIPSDFLKGQRGRPRMLAASTNVVKDYYLASLNVLTKEGRDRMRRSVISDEFAGYTQGMLEEEYMKPLVENSMAYQEIPEAHLEFLRNTMNSLVVLYSQNLRYCEEFGIWPLVNRKLVLAAFKKMYFFFWKMPLGERFESSMKQEIDKVCDGDFSTGDVFSPWHWESEGPLKYLQQVVSQFIDDGAAEKEKKILKELYFEVRNTSE